MSESANSVPVGRAVPANFLKWEVVGRSTNAEAESRALHLAEAYIPTVRRWYQSIKGNKARAA